MGLPKKINGQWNRNRMSTIWKRGTLFFKTKLGAILSHSWYISIVLSIACHTQNSLFPWGQLWLIRDQPTRRQGFAGRHRLHWQVSFPSPNLILDISITLTQCLTYELKDMKSKWPQTLSILHNEENPTRKVGKKLSRLQEIVDFQTIRMSSVSPSVGAQSPRHICIF